MSCGSCTRRVAPRRCCSCAPAAATIWAAPRQVRVAAGMRGGEQPRPVPAAARLQQGSPSHLDVWCRGLGCVVGLPLVKCLPRARPPPPSKPQPAQLLLPPLHARRHLEGQAQRVASPRSAPAGVPQRAAAASSGKHRRRAHAAAAVASRRSTRRCCPAGVGAAAGHQHARAAGRARDRRVVGDHCGQDRLGPGPEAAPQPADAAAGVDAVGL